MKNAKKLIIVCAVCLLSSLLLFGCGSGSSQPKEYDFTKGEVSSDTLKEAFSTEKKDFECTITIEGTFEVKASGGKVVHMYIDGKDIHDSVYLETSAIEGELPANDTMVVAHGTWKHMTDSPNDTSFLLYVDKLTAK